MPTSIWTTDKPMEDGGPLRWDDGRKDKGHSQIRLFVPHPSSIVLQFFPTSDLRPLTSCTLFPIDLPPAISYKTYS